MNFALQVAELEPGGNGGVGDTTGLFYYLGTDRARSHCRAVLSTIHFIPYALAYSVRLFLKRQCDRTLGTKGGQSSYTNPSENGALRITKVGRGRIILALHHRSSTLYHIR